ncbi:hypothetical protein PRZ48_008230 [Zasmidium cellare]|uniref:D-xylose 1-dehydrogenase (NADP(+), D-xylono-1,5-lactone-forming) n=1 Tax=Zasmidium cellare TaxID=395010 RepID=A0ABR0EEW3_ZASCE|nr:hypothetical protein PRZ48_008230 [Zasmidium cellare]
MASLVRRVWSAFSPPNPPPKEPKALKFGILGAANVAPLTLINPAKSHPEVIVQCVAARDRSKAEKFAKANGIPEVYDSYEDILNDPSIDCVLVPLPNALHFEWAAKAIRAGKHVLLEKPSVSNSKEAAVLFRMPELSQPNAPVLLEAFHTRFHPSFIYFQSLVREAPVESVSTESMIPWWGTSKNDIYFNHALAGGSIMSMGTYNFAALRLLFGAEPEECSSCDTHHYTDGIHANCDWDVHARFRFPGGRIGEAKTTLRGPTIWTPSTAKVQLQPVTLPEDQPNQIKTRTRHLTLHGIVHAIFWHRIDIHDTYEIRSKDSGALIRRWEEKRSEKAYTFKEAGIDSPGEDYWMSFRHQLEQFVNRVKGRETLTWVDGEDSIKQMEMIDMAYEKSGLGARPSTGFFETFEKGGEL